MKYRVGYWTACVVALASAGIAVLDGFAGHWPLLAANVASIPIGLNSARIFRKHMPPSTPNHPLATRHAQCLAEIDRLERELADDGVLFLKSDADFDREIQKILPRPAPAPRVRIIDPPRPKILGGLVKNASAICPIGGVSYANCACDTRWASIRQCPARLGQ